MTVLHPTSESQLGFAHLLSAPIAFQGGRPEPAPGRDGRPRPSGDRDRPTGALGRLYGGSLLSSIVHELSVIRAVAPDAGPIAAIDRVDTWPEDAFPGSVELAGRLADGTRVTIGWHFLEDYPAYREDVRFHHVGGSVELTLPVAVPAPRADRPDRLDRRRRDPPAARLRVDRRGVRDGAPRLPRPDPGRRRRSGPGSPTAGPTSSRARWPIARARGPAGDRDRRRGSGVRRRRGMTTETGQTRPRSRILTAARRSSTSSRTPTGTASGTSRSRSSGCGSSSSSTSSSTRWRPTTGWPSPSTARSRRSTTTSRSGRRAASGSSG